MGANSRSRVLLFLGLLLALIGGGWWLLRGEGSVAADSVAGGDDGHAAAALDPASRAPAVTDPAALAREAASGVAAPPEPHRATDGFLVKVVDEESRDPVAGAEVMWLHPEQWLHGPGDDGLHFGWARVSAPRVLTGADGFAVLPHLTGACWIGACTAAASRCYYYYPGQLELPLTIALKPEVRQLVRVEDTTGRPVAGARVGLLREKTVLVTATTDASGNALLRDMQAVRSSGKPQPAYFLSLIGPTASEQRTSYDFDAPPHAAPVLQLALGGEVEILLQDGRGRPLSGAWPVQLRVDDPRRSVWESTAEQADALTLPAREGRVLFPHVALNLPLQASLRGGAGARDDYARFSGPRAAGERMTVVMQRREENPWIALRVLGPAGQALPGLRLTAQFIVEHGESGTFSGPGAVGQTLDDESRLTFEAWAAAFDDAEALGNRRLVELSSADPQSGTPWSAQMVVPTMLAPGRNDLGEVRLAATPLIVAGRVRSSDDQPLRGRALIDVQARDSQGEWQPTRLRTVSGADGRFLIRGLPPPGDLRINAWLNSGVRTELPFQVGATDVELVLEQLILLKGRMLLDPDLPERSSVIRFYNEVTQRGSLIADDGAWSVDGLPDGVYTLALTDARSSRVLWSVEGIAVTGGKPADPEVLDVDLRGKIRPLAISVTDPAGLPIEHWEMCIQGTEDRWWLGVKGPAPVVILTNGAPLDISLRAEGFANLEVRGVLTDQRIFLQRGIAVRVAIVAPSPLPQELEFLVILSDETQNQRGAAYLDATGAGLVWLPQPDTYHLGVSARLRQSDRRSTYDVRLDADTYARRNVMIPAEGMVGILQIGLLPESVEEVRNRHAE